MNTVLHDTPGQTRTPDTTLLELRGACKVFPSWRANSPPVDALGPIDEDIHAGEFLAIVGPSGCGKSTLLALISGLDFPTQGCVKLNGREISGAQSDLGIVFQKDLLLPWRTALENVMLQAELRKMDPTRARGRALELLQTVGLQGFEHFYPHELSGGMRQRVAICRSLLHEPLLLLMDEPFAALDAITRDQMSIDFQAFWTKNRTTVIFITHNIAEAIFLADRVAVMTTRPGRFACVMDIDLPRPRGLAVRETRQFARYVAEVRELFEQHGVFKKV